MQSDNFQIRRADREDVEQLGRLQESVCVECMRMDARIYSVWEEESTTMNRLHA